ncbi:hypothetical protein [Nonomuraea sp. KM90]|uniref:hypothetical protein n=1 Tax=Nonomuraea sp. KM90 TaxID=3457428 RepID=UPI003FCD74D0
MSVVHRRMDSSRRLSRGADVVVGLSEIQEDVVTVGVEQAVGDLHSFAATKCLYLRLIDCFNPLGDVAAGSHVVRGIMQELLCF